LDIGVLEDEAYPAPEGGGEVFVPHGLDGDVPPEGDYPAFGKDEAGKYLFQGRLAAAVRAQERQALAGGDAEVNAAEGRLPGTVGVRNAVEFIYR